MTQLVHICICHCQRVGDVPVCVVGKLPLDNDGVGVLNMAEIRSQRFNCKLFTVFALSYRLASFNLFFGFFFKIFCFNLVTIQLLCSKVLNIIQVKVRSILKHENKIWTWYCNGLRHYTAFSIMSFRVGKRILVSLCDNRK